MNRMIAWVLAAGMIACLVPGASAKRLAPRGAAPVTIDGIEYRAPVERMGCVEAWDAKSDKMLWWRQIYVVVIEPNLEKDVQDVFIRGLKAADSALTITNERGGEFKLDLKTLEVQAVKGSAVIRR